MGTLYVLLGKSGSGKDTICQHLLNECLDMSKLQSVTTRPIRDGEIQGREYLFVNDKDFQALLDNRSIIESRTYNTVFGEWKYGTLAPKNVFKDYLIVAPITLIKPLVQGIKSLTENMEIKIIYVDLDPNIRLRRMLSRDERDYKGKSYDYVNQKVQEICRRYLADEEDFNKYFDGVVIDLQVDNSKDLRDTVSIIKNYIQSPV